MTTWTPDDAHEALLRWGVIAARRQDKGMGFPGQCAFTQERIAQPFRALEPPDYIDAAFDTTDAAVNQLPDTLKIAVLCYYKPGHLRALADLGVDGKGRSRSPSIRVIAAHMLIGRDAVARRLSEAKLFVAKVLTSAAESDRIKATCIA